MLVSFCSLWLFLAAFARHGSALFILWAICLVAALPARAGPASPDPFVITQPDGTFFRAYKRGDEFQNWTETADGYTVVKGSSSGFYEYATQTDGGALQPSGVAVLPTGKAMHLDPGLLPPKGLRPPRNGELDQYQKQFLQNMHDQRFNSGAAMATTPTGQWTPTPVSGSKKVLMILVNFKDATLSSGAATYWNNAVFNTSSASVAKFYQDNSFGTLAVTPVTSTQSGNPSGVVTVTLAQNHPNCGSTCTRSTEGAWINSALSAAASYVNFAALDANGDGTISVDEAMIYFVLAGYEASANNGLTPSIWAHAWGFSGVAVAGKNVNHWALNGEKLDSSRLMQMGVIAHEMGHALVGLPDLYDTTSTNEGLGIFSLMAGGSWGSKSGETGGTTPAALDAWSRFYLGWSVPQTPGNGAMVTFNGALTGISAPVILMNSSTSTSEYWLVENRTNSGWDAGMYRSLGNWSGGLLIQHIDGNIGTKNGNSFNAYVSGSHQGNMAEEPSSAACSLKSTSNSTSGCASILFYSGNATAFNSGTTPNSSYYSGVASNLGISGVSAAGSVMTAVVQTTGSSGSIPICNLSASPSSITAGSNSTLTASCAPAATSYTWTGASCSSTSATCMVAPTTTTTYTVAGTNASGTGAATRATVTVTSSTPTALTNGQTVTSLSGAMSGQQFFYIDVPGGATSLTVQTSGGSGDVDLYVRRDSLPTTASYDCSPYVAGNTESCDFSNPTAGRYYILLDGYESFSGVSLSASYAVAVSSYTLSVTKSGTGSGTVISSPAGISCGSSCSASFASGTSLTLTATPATGSTFTGWSGACTGAQSCTVSMNAVKSVTATFANCTYTLNANSATAPATASTGSISVTSSCAWAATSNASWIAITSGSSVSGNGTVGYTVAVNTSGSPRTGTLTIAGQTFTVTQAVAVPVCTLSASSSSITVGSSATLTASCTPAASSYTWAGGTCAGTTAATCTVTPASTTTYSVTGTNAGGSGAAAGATVTVNACTYALGSSSASVAASASTGSVSVTSSCAWTATSNASWISITSGASGSGNGTVGYTVTANTSGSPRTGTLSIAGQTFTVTQAVAVPVCTLSASSSSITVGSSATLTASCTPVASSYTWAGGTCAGTTAATCTVTPTSTTIYSVTGTNAGGTGAAASSTVTVNACTYALGSSSASVSASTITGSINVTSSCAWTATSNTSWIAITSGPSVSGNGTVGYTVAANTSGSPRTGTLTIAGQTFTVTQAVAVPVCTLSASSSSITVGSSATLTASCTPAASSYTWAGGTCAGTTAATCTVTPTSTTIYSVTGINAGGTGAAASATVTVNACTYALGSSSASVAASTITGSVSVTSSCAWTTTSNASWISITSGASGSGNGTVGYTVAVNTDTTTRTGTLTIAGKTFTVTQAAGSTVAAPICTLSANPSSITSGGSSTLTATCSPTATSYIWTGGSCAGTSGATCTVSPTATTTYSVQGSNAGGANQAASATVTVTANTASYTVPGTLGNDVFVLTAGNSYFGGAGNDTYIISPSTLRGGVTAKVIDNEGDNLLQLVDGMTLTASTFYTDAAQLTLSSGAIVQILGASKFKFQLGANVLAGDTAAVLTYSQFVSSLGASLSGTLPASGTAGYVVPTGFAQAAAPVPSVAGSSYAVPATLDDDVIVPSGGNSYLGGGGNDVYIINPYTLSGAVTAKLIDSEGSNVIQLVKGLTIASSSFFSNAVQLTLSNGASVQVLGASGFIYQLGANAPAGVTTTSLSYAQFAAALGASVPAGTSAVSGSANFVVP